VYVIQEGRVRLTSFGFDGKERHLMIIGPSGLVGDCALRSTRTYTVSAVAATDSVVSMVPTATMLAALAQDARLAAQQQQLAGLRFRILLRHVAVQGRTPAAAASACTCWTCCTATDAPNTGSGG
jgi:CRP-like cAMP-binding protein